MERSRRLLWHWRLAMRQSLLWPPGWFLLRWLCSWLWGPLRVALDMQTCPGITGAIQTEGGPKKSGRSCASVSIYARSVWCEKFDESQRWPLGQCTYRKPVGIIEASLYLRLAFLNATRLHSRPDYVSPMHFEKNCLAVHARRAV